MRFLSSDSRRTQLSFLPVTSSPIKRTQKKESRYEIVSAPPGGFLCSWSDISRVHYDCVRCECANEPATSDTYPCADCDSDVGAANNKSCRRVSRREFKSKSYPS